MHLPRVLAISLAVVSLTALADTQLELAPGSQKVLSIPGISRVAIGDPEVADVKTIGNGQVLILGVAPGKTSLLVWTGKGTSEPKRFAIEVGQAAAAKAEGVKLQLGKGTQKVLAIPHISRVAIGDPEVADVKTIGNGQVLILGVAPGQTTLLVWTGPGEPHTYAIEVVGETAAPDPDAVQLHLEPGTQQTLTIPGLVRVAIGDPEVADVKTLGHDQLLVLGVQAGHTTLMAWTETTRRTWSIEVGGPPRSATPFKTGAPLQGPTAELQVGQSLVGLATGITGTTNGDRTVLDLRIDATSISVTALKPGRAKVVLERGEEQETIDITVR